MGLQTITSVQNPLVKSTAKLRDRKGRKQTGQIIIDGWRELSRAIEADVQIVSIFVSESFLDSLCSEDEAVLASVTSDRFCLAPAAFSKIAFGNRDNGIVAVANVPNLSVDRLSVASNALIAVIEAVEKPGNLGAIVRSADGAGFDAVVVADSVTDVFNPNAIRASLGTIFGMAMAQTTAEHALAWLASNELTCFAARVDGGRDYFDADFTGPTAIVLGSESHGLSDQWTADRIQGIRLPMLGAADSLNVSAASAILFYEARRQRMLAG